MTQHQALASVAPGLYQILCGMTDSAEKQHYRNLLQAPYLLESEHILLCAFGDLREFLATLRRDAGIPLSRYFELCGEANRLYGQRLGVC